MHLINTQTLDIEEFYGTEIPKYAILSHTWRQREEVTFQEWLRRDTDTSVQKKSGFTKILVACQLARSDSCDWLWVDTNCIDKTSSAELSEAINSMYEWYKESQACYVYLSDMSFSPGSEHLEEFWNRFSKSRWWTRGWTLQELLAPERVLFYTQEWKLISDRDSLSDKIQRISGISKLFLYKERSDPITAPASEKMSWLSLRQTTRVEDTAYCMFGLFNINLPLLYGEGRKAFWRLQEEIIRVSNDHTLFCWTWTKTVPEGWVSMLAPWPDTFANSKGFQPLERYNVSKLMPTPYSMTNMGLSIKLPIIRSLTSLFIFLDVTHMGYHHSYAAYLHVAPNSKSGFRRCHYPRSPILLREFTTETDDRRSTNRLKDLIIASKVLTQPLLTGYSNDIRQKYNILLLVSSKVAQYQLEDLVVFSIALPQHRANTGNAVYNREKDLFVLAPVGPSAHAGLWHVGLPRSNEFPAIYLFFAVLDAAGPSESWHCKVAFYEDIERRYGPHPGNESSLEGRITACGHALFQKQLSKVFSEPRIIKTGSKTQDGLLRLEIRDKVRIGPGFELRSAELSTPGDFQPPIIGIEKYAFGYQNGENGGVGWSDD
ncbi:HET-domain-containing protein [Xylaria telfairii]|nr:HET-domain-containing protein [Xylaria telfairii]